MATKRARPELPPEPAGKTLARVAELDEALRVFMATRAAMLAANEAHQAARQRLTELLGTYGISGYVP